MNRKKIMKIIIASAIMTGGITACSSSKVFADEISNSTSIQEDADEILQDSKNKNDNKKQNESSIQNQDSKTVQKQNDNNISIESQENMVQETGARNVQKGKIINVSSNLRIRQGAGTSYNTIGYLLNGSEISIISTSGEWYKISYGTLTGYVSKSYVQIISSSSDALESSNGIVVNVTSYLNVRSGASTNNSVIGTVKNGQELKITGESGSFYIINYNGQVGYVSKDYVKKQGNSQSVPSGSSTNNTQNTSSSSNGKVINVSSYLNVRSGAGTGNSVLGTLKNGQDVSIIGESGQWFEISFNGQKGYVSKEYVQKNSTSSSSSSSSENVAVSNEKSTGKVINVQSNLRVRSASNTSSSVLGYLLNNQTVTICGEENGFYKIEFAGKAGFVSKEYISKESGSNNSSSSSGSYSSKTGYVTASVLNVRKGASTSSQIEGTLKLGNSVTVIGEESNFYKINYGSVTAYVSKDYITFNNINVSQSSKYSIVLENMKAHLGTPYCWGGYGQLLTTSSLNQLKSTFKSEAANGAYSRVEQYVNKGYRAFDCSGLMQWGYAQAGVKIGRTTWDQINNGYEVQINDVKPGDLLFYSNLQHVGMYIGNGQWIEAPNKNNNVRIVDVPWRLIGRARRIL